MVTLTVCLFLSGMAMAQDLPPGILLFSAIKRHVKEELQHLPNTSCLETIRREHQASGGKPQLLDNIRLEVLTNGEKELYASPGDRRFSKEHPISYAGSGVLGNGFFGLYLKDILLNDALFYAYKGESETDGRRGARYDFRIPLMSSGQMMRILEGSGKVGLHGSFWADPQTYDVIRLEMIADSFPPTLPLTDAVTSINYRRTVLEDNVTLLLPESAEFRMVKFSGETSHNRITFSNCRLFAAHSTIDFDSADAAEQATRFGATVIDDTLRALPEGLQIAVKLRSRISSEVAVGTLIDGVVADSVFANGALVIGVGSPVRGRVRRLERYTDPLPHFIVGLEFTEVELQGIRYRFIADLVEMETSRHVEQTLIIPSGTEVVHGLENGQTQVQRTVETISLPNVPGVAAFFFKGSKLDLRPGFRTVWKTRLATP